MLESRLEDPVAPALPPRTTTTTPSPTHATQPPVQAQQPVPPPGPALLPTSYQPYPYAQPQYIAQPRIIPFDKTWHWAKIGLTVASIIVCLVLLGISVAASIGPGYDSWNITIYWVGPLVGIAVIWDLAELITIWACGKRNGAEHRRGIHPGAHVGMGLAIWLIGFFCVLLSAMSYTSANYQIRACDQEDGSSSSSSNRYYDYCDDDEYALLSTNGIYLTGIRVMVAFTSLLTVVHFLLFVRACIEINLRNRSRQTFMLLPPQQMYYGPPAGLAPYGYPPQAYMSGAAPNAANNEKSPASVQQPPINYSNLAGFYAPAGSATTPAPAPSQSHAVRGGAAEASGSA